MPSDYEVVTSDLLYYPEHGFAVDTPVSQWYSQYQGAASPRPQAVPSDPEETTYADYVRRRREQEAHLDRICDISLREPLPGLVQFWRRFAGPLRYPQHALQMQAAYLGSMAPEGRLTVASAFEAADAMQVVHRLAYRLRFMQVDGPDPTVGDDARDVWLSDPAWQPLRELFEHLLTIRDYKDAFFAMYGVVKPLWYRLIAQESAAASTCPAIADPAFALMFETFAANMRWHQACAEAFAPFVAAGRGNRTDIGKDFVPLARRATQGILELLSDLGAHPRPVDAVMAEVLNQGVKE